MAALEEGPGVATSSGGRARTALVRRAPPGLLALLFLGTVVAGCTPRPLPTVEDDSPPAVRVVSPGTGDRVPNSTPTVEIEYGDDGSGVRVTAFVLRINGVDYSAEFDHHSRGATGRISSVRPLPLGENRIQVTVEDRAGNIGRAEATFVNVGGGWILAEAVPGAEPERHVELVLDASGSMREMLGFQTRMDVAKGAVKSLVDALPSGTPLGFRVFEDCGRIRALVPIAPVAPARFAAELDSVRPAGGTPIVAALLQSFDALSRLDEGQRIAVLVTDGGESCGGSIAGAVHRAQDAATRIVVIGFDIDDAGITAQLRRLAEDTGGAFYDARQPDELAEALERSVLRLEYAVLAGDGSTLATGVLGGDPVEVPPGAYRVALATIPPVIVPDVRVGELTETVVVLRESENGLAGQVRGPRPRAAERERGNR